MQSCFLFSGSLIVFLLTFRTKTKLCSVSYQAFHGIVFSVCLPLLDPLPILKHFPISFSSSKMTVYNPINIPCCYMPWHPCILCLEFLLISVFKILLRSPSSVESLPYTREVSLHSGSKLSTCLDTFVSLM